MSCLVENLDVFLMTGKHTWVKRLVVSVTIVGAFVIGIDMEELLNIECV